jgi:hypothetical protein
MKLACGNELASDIDNGVVAGIYPDSAPKIGLTVASVVLLDGVDPIHMTPSMLACVG